MDKDGAQKADSDKPIEADSRRVDKGKGLPGKILESATGLWQSGVSGTKYDTALSLSEALANGEKGASSSRSSSAWSRATGSSAELENNPGSTTNSSSNSVGESFRSTQPTTSDNAPSSRSENGFYTPAQNYLAYESDLGEYSKNCPDSKGKSVMLDQAQNAFHQSLNTSLLEEAWAQSSSFTQSLHSDRNVQNLDGAEVSQLLSDPHFDPHHWTGDEHPTDDRPVLSSAEGQAAQLFYGYFSDKEISQNVELNRTGSNSRSTASQPNTGLSQQFESALSFSVEQQNLYEIDTFFDGLISYHEDVWGYAKPLVEDARKEIRDTSLGQSPDGPALQRLRMILAHVST